LSKEDFAFAGHRPAVSPKCNITTSACRSTDN
jgi:hypothetical protein